MVVASFATPPVHFKDQTPVSHTVTLFATNPGVLAGTGTATTAPDSLYPGTQSTRLVFGSVQTQYLLRISPAVNIHQDSFFRVAFKAKNKANTVNLASAVIALGNNITNYLAYNMTANISDTQQTYYGAWDSLYLTKRKFSRTGSPNDSLIDSLILQMTAQVGTIDTLYFGEVAAYPPMRAYGSLIITADDAYDSMQVLGDSVLRALGVRVTRFVNGNTVGTAPFTSLATLQADYAYGDEISNHYNRHDTIPRISNDSGVSIITSGYNFIRNNSFKRSPELACMPYGASTRYVDSFMRVSGIVDFNRSLTQNIEGEPQQFGNKRAIKTAIILSNTTTLAQARAKIDTAAVSKTTMVLLVHNLCTACVTNSVTWRKADWDSLITYANTKVQAGTLWMGPLGNYLTAVDPPIRGLRTRSRSRSR